MSGTFGAMTTLSSPRINLRKWSTPTLFLRLSPSDRVRPSSLSSYRERGRIGDAIGDTDDLVEVEGLILRVEEPLEERVEALAAQGVARVDEVNVGAEQARCDHVGEATAGVEVVRGDVHARTSRVKAQETRVPRIPEGQSLEKFGRLLEEAGPRRADTIPQSARRHWTPKAGSRVRSSSVCQNLVTKSCPVANGGLLTNSALTIGKLRCTVGTHSNTLEQPFCSW